MPDVADRGGIDLNVTIVAEDEADLSGLAARVLGQ